MDTSLTVGEAVMVLCNYECRTRETLSQDDLHDKKLATKLLLEDYDFKSQVFIFLTLPLLNTYMFYHDLLGILNVQ